MNIKHKNAIGVVIAMVSLLLCLFYGFKISYETYLIHQQTPFFKDDPNIEALGFIGGGLILLGAFILLCVAIHIHEMIVD
jgi:hypothetical protein